MTTSTLHPPSGLYTPRPLKHLYYGPGAVRDHLLSLLPTPESRALIVTGNSLATKTPLVSRLESLLGPSRHAHTFSKIQQHAPEAQLDEAAALLASSPSVDTVISLGGGSPIDTAKALVHRAHARTNGATTIFHIAIPTTLSAAECTHVAGYTLQDGTKTTVMSPLCAVGAILYDPAFAAHTPKRLLLATGVRALDHALETLYHPSASEVPAKSSALAAAGELFRLLPRAEREFEPVASNGGDAADGKGGGEDKEQQQQQQQQQELLTRLMLAAYGSLGMLGLNLTAGLGLSHAMGYALGSPYGIPHGETSCLTLGKVLKLKARRSRDDAEQIARALGHIGGGGGSGGSSGGNGGNGGRDELADALEVGDRVEELVRRLGLQQTLTSKGVGREQVDVIVERAIGGKKKEEKKSSGGGNGGDLYGQVEELVRSLF